MKLSPRMIQIVVLIGRDQLTYDQVAADLRIKTHTVIAYAEQIRNRLGSRRSPRKAISEFYWENRVAIDAGYKA